MSPAAIALLFQVLQEAIKYEPALMAELKVLCSKPDPTPADWALLHSRIAETTYAKLVPNSALPPG